MMRIYSIWAERMTKKPKPLLLRDEPADESYPLIAPLGRDLSISCLIRVPRCCYDAVAFLNKPFRAFIRSGELYKHRREAGVEEPWIFLSCDHMMWEAFEPHFRGWIYVPAMPMDLYFLHAGKESLAVGHELLVFGRSMEDMAIYKYTLTTKKWTNDNAPMNTRRCVFASASVGTIGYVAGGVTIAGDILSSAEVYNSEKGTWTEIPGMKMPRRMAAGVMMDGKFYVIGGATSTNTDSEYLTSAEVYDPKTNTWDEIEEMCAPWVGGWGSPPLCAVVKNELYAAEVTKKEVWRYVKEKNVWVTIGKLPEIVDSSSGYGMAFRACGDRLVVIGGPDDGRVNGAVRVFSWVPPEPANAGGGIELPLPPPQWELIGARKIGRFVHNCAVMSC